MKDCLQAAKRITIPAFSIAMAGRSGDARAPAQSCASQSDTTAASADLAASDTTQFEAMRSTSSQQSAQYALAGQQTLQQYAASFCGTVLAGGIAGCVMWGTVLPIDVAKTRIQVAQKGDRNDVGVLRMLGRMWAEGGRHTVWSGLRPTLLRAFPANAAQWMVWELSLSALHRF